MVKSVFVHHSKSLKRPITPAHAMLRASGAETAIFMTDARRVPDPCLAIRALPPNSIVICRDYDHPNRESCAANLCTATHLAGHMFLVAGDVALARKVGADGMHLPEHQLTQARPTGFRFYTAACHSRLALWRAERLGVDLALVSPVFETRSHPGAKPLGVHRFARLVAGLRIPVAALGGVTHATAAKLNGIGISAVAAIDGFSEG